MSHKRRKDNVCLNCGHLVEYTYCSYCGQENIEPNESILSLALHFHGHSEEYQQSIFSTIKTLITRPGFLTREYIKGKRKKYNHPVRIYLVISFIYFILIMGVFDKPQIEHYSKTDPDSQLIFLPIKILGFQQLDMVLPRYNSVEEYDSIQTSLPPNQRDKGILRAYIRRSARIYEDYNPQKATELLAEKAHETIPKAIFFLIPILGFFLWLFHSKKRYTFTNHLIFCIHFNSVIFIFLSIATLLCIPLEHIQDTTIQITIWQLTLLAILIYFIIALRTTYQQSIGVSIIKGVALMAIYICFILLTGVAFFIYPFMTI